MAKEYFVICDGCGERQKTPVADALPASLQAVTVSIKAGPDKAFDLCASCYERLLRDADPTQWQRYATDARRA